MLIRLLLLFCLYTTSFAAEVNQYHFVLDRDSDRDKGEGEIVNYSKYFSFGPNDSAGFIGISHRPKQSFWLSVKYPGFKKTFAEKVYAAFPTRNQTWAIGPRRGFDVYLGKNKTASLTSSLNVTEVSVLLPAVTRTLTIDLDAISDTKKITIDVDKSIPINPKDDTRANRATWISPPPYIQNSDKTYSDQAHILVVDDDRSLGVNSTCLASDSIGKIHHIEVSMISPIGDASYSPISLAVMDLSESAYNISILLQARVNDETLRQELEGKAAHVFRVTCFTTKGESLTKQIPFEVKRAFPRPGSNG